MFSSIKKITSGRGAVIGAADKSEQIGKWRDEMHEAAMGVRAQRMIYMEA
jgi:hypothetical protein